MSVEANNKRLVRRLVHDAVHERNLDVLEMELVDGAMSVALLLKLG